MLTVLIPTHNRPNYLWRCLYFLSSTASEAIISIADSSEDETFNQNRHSIFTEFQKLRINHIDCRGIGITEKYQIALAKIKTPFVVPCGDDDFLVYESALE